MFYRLIASSMVLVAGSALAAPATYKIDSRHTFPSFEADHQGGLSMWRGKFDTTTGTINYDKEGKVGSVDVTIDTASVDFGLGAMNDVAKSDKLFDVAKHPTATFKGTFANFKRDAPTKVVGEFMLRGVTKPLTLTINSFLCRVNPVTKKEKCGADASATFSRADYGMPWGKDSGFKMDVKLQIQVEADKVE